MPVAEITLHGRPMSYRQEGNGPLVLLIHGLASTMQTWDAVVPQLARTCTVLAPDLPGFGRSAAPAGDYSLGANACALRDLLDALGHQSATVVGHSLGGGVAMQFGYQFPERCDRLVLVASGGLGSDVSPLLRAAALPGSELVIAVIASRRVSRVGRTLGCWLDTIGVRGDPGLAEYARAYATLADADARRTFVHALRTVVDHRGQRVSAADRLYLMESLPTLFIWGRKDRIIPVDHALRSHEAVPGSQLEIFERAGHVPHVDDPERFARTLDHFIATTNVRATTV